MRVNKNDELSKALEEVCPAPKKLDDFTPQLMRRIEAEKPFIRRQHNTPFMLRLLLSPLAIVAAIVTMGTLFRSEIISALDKMIENETVAKFLSSDPLIIISTLGALGITMIVVLIMNLEDQR